MKQFNLSSFDEHNGEYIVWLGNRICCRFASKRHVRYFLADTNRFLNAAMIELNEYYIRLFSEYRNIWFTMMNFKNGSMVNQADKERQLSKLVMDIMDQFNRAGNSFTGSANAGWAFIHLQNICLMQKEMLQLLIDLNKKRNNTYTYQSLHTLTRHITDVEKRICTYPDPVPSNCLGIKSNK